MTDFLARVEARRQQTYHRDSPLAGPAEALELINAAGFVLLFPAPDVELPNLWTIAPSKGEAWGWKDEIPVARQAYYGKIFHGRAGLAALDMMPALYAVSRTADLGGDRFEMYRLGLISAEVHRLTGILNAKGPLSTRQLRREAGMLAKEHKSRFDRALQEGQAAFLIARSHALPPEAGSYTYIWDGFNKLWPEVVEAGLRLPYEEGLAQIITRYVSTAAAAPAAMIARIFGVEVEHVTRLGDWLAGQKALGVVEHGGEVYYTAPDLM
ncbi:MAG: hypothetical protein Kow00124_15910 [Anaerolineae bacterium]